MVNQKKVLVVDDDALTRTMLEDILKRHGYLVMSASDGEEGLAAFKSFKPDVVLLDIVMPGMDGIEVCEAMRRIESPIRPAIIVVSIVGDKKVISEALGKGADDFIVKPVDEVELIARVNAHARIVDCYREIDEDKRNSETILSISTSVSALLDTNEVLSTIVRKVAEITSAVRCSIVLIKKDSEGYVLVSHDNPNARNLKIDLRKYPEIREVITTKKPLVVQDIATNPLTESVHGLIKDLRDMSVLVVPVVFNEEVLGTLFLRARRVKRSFTAKEVNFCQIVANSSYPAIKNAKLFEEVMREREELRELSITDRLTALFNHHFFYTRLDEEFERAVRYDNSLSIIMLDVDNFKHINDTYGHRVGDIVLKELATILKRCVRKVDLVARYGGEEFVVMLPQTPLPGAMIEAERIRDAVAEHCYANLMKEKITVSLGLCSYPHKGIINSGDMVDFADKALYEAKKAGKNCVKVYGEG
ncbi:MAG: diguanylate cyclase [Thermodesulfobacteriota bacterium]